MATGAYFTATSPSLSALKHSLQTTTICGFESHRAIALDGLHFYVCPAGPGLLSSCACPGYAPSAVGPKLKVPSTGAQILQISSLRWPKSCKSRLWCGQQTNRMPASLTPWMMNQSCQLPGTHRSIWFTQGTRTATSCSPGSDGAWSQLKPRDMQCSKASFALVL